MNKTKSFQIKFRYVPYSIIPFHSTFHVLHFTCYAKYALLSMTSVTCHLTVNYEHSVAISGFLLSLSQINDRDIQFQVNLASKNTATH